MRELKVALVEIAGIAVGALVGFLAPLIICFIFDSITNPSPGSGLMTVGWVFCFLTIPIGAIIGAVCFKSMASRAFK